MFKLPNLYLGRNDTLLVKAILYFNSVLFWDVIIMTKQLQILIVGSGIAGTAVAVALQKLGFKSDIIEKTTSLNFGVGGLLLSSNATEAAYRLGLASTLEKSAFEMGNIQYRNMHNDNLISFDTKRHFPDKKPFYTVHRNVLLAALAGKLDKNIIQFGKTISHIENLTTGVNVSFSDESQKHYDFVIAADGINSSTRASIFGEDRAANISENSGLSCIRLVINRPKTLSDATYMLGKGRAVALLPIDNKLAYCPFVFSSSLIEHLNTDDTAEILTHLYSEFTGEVPKILTDNHADIQKAHLMPLNSLRLNTWYQNRVLLLGDAAHALIPTQPQGAGLALEDALVFSETLASVKSMDEVLTVYQKRRYKRVTEVQNSGSERVKAMELSKTSFGFFLSQTVMKLVGQRKLKKDWSAIIDEIA